MTSKRKIMLGAMASVGLIILILDSKRAILGASEGLKICLEVIIPSLLPFFILSSMLTTILVGEKIDFIHKALRFCGIPDGAESLLLIGLIGGYPTGAKVIADAYNQGALSKTDAERLLGFSCNCGPAFIFGVIGLIFDSPIIPWLLWLIHIVSALIICLILYQTPQKTFTPYISRKFKPGQIIDGSIRSMALVCMWVILFRILISFAEKWFLWILPNELKVVIIGFAELSNGCVALNTIINPALRFILSSGFIAFGGICVLMQTISIAAPLNCRVYFLGKILHCMLSVLLAGILQLFLFKPDAIGTLTLWGFPLILLVAVFATKRILKLNNSSFHLTNDVY